jgi:hypothetical protein
VRIGAALSQVSIPGQLSADNISQTTLIGSNTVRGRLDFKSGAYTSMANGANEINLGTNTFMRLSGASSFCAITGIEAAPDGALHVVYLSGAVTNCIVNEANSVDYAPTAVDANRIVTGTGRNLYLTNNPTTLTLIYNAAITRWVVVEHSN